jgi:Ser/Thr protein kinase RdoA (MazF antagonist)
MTSRSGDEATEEPWAEERLAEIGAVRAGLHELARGKQPGAVVAACLQTAARADA